MAKNDITDYSTDADSNTDIGGLGLGNTDTAGNLRGGIQQLMRALARMNKGDAPLDQTFLIRNTADTTKAARVDVANVPNSMTRILDAEALNRNGAYIETIYTAGGTHTFADSTRFFQIEGVGGGGGGGGADGQGATTVGAAGGGSSGLYGFTPVLTRGAITSGTVVIGAGGAGGSVSSNGSDGGDTTWVDGANNLTWSKGFGGNGVVAAAFGRCGQGAAHPVLVAGIYGGGQPGDCGIAIGAVPQGISGAGGSNPIGSGGRAVLLLTGNGDGNAGEGRGAGGSGAVSSATNANGTGGAGSAGLLIVREW